MRRLTVLTLASLASLTLSSCNLFNGGDQEPQVESTNVPLPAQPAEQAKEEFAEPMVPAAPSAAAIASAELIQSTDPNERLQQIAKSRPDPYATVPIPPKPKAAPPRPTTPAGGGSGPVASNGGTSRPSGGGSSGGSNTAGRPGGPGGAARPGGTLPSGGSTGSTIQPLPSLPQPQIATAVEVTGVVQIGGERFAIIKAPNEPTSRYVKAGQRLANGRVLVKRIETRGGEEPIVILEENGIEVARPVGSTGGPVEETPTASAGGQPAQAVSVPPLPPG